MKTRLERLQEKREELRQCIAEARADLPEGYEPLELVRALRFIEATIAKVQAEGVVAAESDMAQAVAERVQLSPREIH